MEHFTIWLHRSQSKTHSNTELTALNLDKRHGFWCRRGFASLGFRVPPTARRADTASLMPAGLKARRPSRYFPSDCRQAPRVSAPPEPESRARRGAVRSPSCLTTRARVQTPGCTPSRAGGHSHQLSHQQVSINERMAGGAEGNSGGEIKESEMGGRQPPRATPPGNRAAPRSHAENDA